MVMILPPQPRYRTRTSHLAPFWAAAGLYRHDPYDETLQAAEWDRLGFSSEILRAFRRAGFSCYRLIPPCPDWLLGSVPGLGPARLAEVRRLLPYAREIYAGPPCPGAALETERRLAASKIPGQDAFLARQVRRHLFEEPPV